MRANDHSNKPEDYDRARILRRNPTPQEQRLWLALRGESKKYGIKFRRQHVVHPFIVDFACLKAKLAVEIDGYSHDLALNGDATRAQKIQTMGY